VPAQPEQNSIRLFHISDIHIALDKPGWRANDWFNKRVPGWINARYFGRGKQFENAGRVIERFAEEVRRERPDCLIFSGDASGLGFENEMAHAAELLHVTSENGVPGIAVPGNHDYYTRSAAASGNFERYFAHWQLGQRVDDATYPFARRVGDFWLVAVNSATGNRWFWDAAGGVGIDQVLRLERLFESLDDRPRILVTHYPLCLASGEPEHRHRGLRDLANFLYVVKHGKICLWLHGHRHSPYHHQRSAYGDFPIICAGSTTREGSGSYGDYTIAGNRLLAIRRAFSPEEGSFREVERFELTLPSFD
jgi:3',5'-cyclic AMP phosphodiesterase CpdA